MVGPIHCTCGAVLVENVTDSGVQPIGSDEPITFRRKTDYIICPQCLATYHAPALLAGGPVEDARVEK